MQVIQQNKYSRPLSYITLFISIQLGNTLLLESKLNLLIALPQIVFVLYLLFRNDVESALIWHIVFNVTACDLNTLEDNVVMFSYPTLKLIGPITISYIILGLIWICSKRKPVNIPYYILFFKFRRLFNVLFFMATILGLFGMIFSEITVAHFIPSFRYMLIAVLYLDILSRLYYVHFMKRCYEISVYLIIASPIVSVLTFYFIGLSYNYSIFESFIANAVIPLAPCLLLFMLYDFSVKIKMMILCSLICFFLLAVLAGRGSQFMTLGIAFSLLIYLVYFSKIDVNLKAKTTLKILLPFCFIFIISYVSYMLLHVGESLASNKLSQFLSLFSMFSNGNFNIDNVATSPYIRIAEVLNVIDNGLNKPFQLIFGQGYGGYYTDSLGLFTGIDLSAGAFSYDDVSKGEFWTAHSMYPNVLLYHGIIGFVLVLYLGILYIKKIHFCPLIFSSIILLLYSLYYNVPLLTVCIFMMFASELKIKYKIK